MVFGSGNVEWFGFFGRLVIFYKIRYILILLFINLIFRYLCQWIENLVLYRYLYENILVVLFLRVKS